MPSRNLSSRYKTSSVPTTTPRSILSIVLHLVAFVSLSNAFRLLWSPSPIKQFMDGQVGGQWSFLTVLSLAVSWLTFAAALLKDLAPGIKVLDRIKTSLMIIAVPVEGLVSLLYWGMQFYDPDLLTPKDGMFKIPVFLDLSIHALPALFLWLDFLVFSPPMSKQANPLLISGVATLAYTTWMEYTSYWNKRFPYPFLDTMSRPQRSAFYLAVIPVLLGLFYLANGIHRVVRGRPSGIQAEGAEKLQSKIEGKRKAL